MSNSFDAKCPKCYVTVRDHDQSICCDLCDSWFHLRCSLLRNRDFKRFLIDKNLTWYCAFCLKAALPFQSMTDNNFRNFNSIPQESENILNLLTSPTSGFSRNCSVCNKTVCDVKNSIPCQDCQCLIHKRCSGLKPCQMTNLAKTLKFRRCDYCIDPYTKITDAELLSFTFNSNITCPCQKVCVDRVDIDIYDVLETLDLCTLRLSEHDPLFENDLDSQANFHNNVDYYTNHKFHKLIQNSCIPKGEHKLSLIHTNTSSLLGNLDILENLLLDFDLEYDFIALSETWHVKSNDARFTSMCIPGFHPYEGIQGSSNNGGCGFFIRDNLSFHKRKDLNKSFKSDICEYEAFWVELENKKDVNLILGVVYNHPRRDPAQVIEFLSTTLRKLTKENKKIILSGDFNFELLAFQSKPVVEDFLNTMFANFLQPLILKPTRRTENQKPSLIDNIFINSVDNTAWSGHLISEISDHMPNCLLLDQKLSKFKQKPEFKRDFKISTRMSMFLLSKIKTFYQRLIL